MSWEKVNLGDVATFVNGYPFKPSDWSNEGLEIIRIQNLTKSNTTDCNFYAGKIPEKYRVSKGDLLISWSATLGIFEWDSEDAWLNQHIFKVVFDKQDVDKSFFKYLITHVLDDLKKKVHGATMQHITKGNFDNTLVPLPPLHIQKQIANILDKADALRKKDQQLLQKYYELAQAIFIDMFGDPVKNEKGWEEDIVINYCDCIVPGRDKPKSFTGNIPWITTNDLIQLGKTKISKSQIGLDNNEIKEVRARKIPKNSVLMTCVGDLGIISIADCEMVVNQQLHAFQCKDLLNEWFLMFNLYYQKNYFYKMASSTTVPYMNKTICNNVPIIIPPLKLQNQFSILYQNILEQQEKLNHQIQYSGHLFQSLLQKAFTGELIHD